MVFSATAFAVSVPDIQRTAPISLIPHASAVRQAVVMSALATCLHVATVTFQVRVARNSHGKSRLTHALKGAENLDANRCASVYETTSSLQPAVASAISSATVAAQAALATRDPTKLQDLPECAVSSRALPTQYQEKHSDRLSQCRSNTVFALGSPPVAAVVKLTVSVPAAVRPCKT